MARKICYWAFENMALAALRCVEAGIVKVRIRGDEWRSYETQVGWTFAVYVDDVGYWSYFMRVTAPNSDSLGHDELIRLTPILADWKPNERSPWGLSG